MVAKCDFCGMEFKCRTNHDRHVSVKHSENAKTFHCKPCDKTYLYKYNLNKHNAKCHPNNGNKKKKNGNMKEKKGNAKEKNGNLKKKN